MLVYGVLLFFALLYLYPFAVQLVTALKTAPDAVANPMSFVPDPFSTAAFSRLFETDFTLWFANSVVVSLCVTAGRVFFDSLAGYALARMRFRGRVGVFNAVIAVMAVPGVVLLIPKFLVLNYLGIYNTYPALFLPLIADAAGVFIMKQFFETIPVSVEEAARIDGAGPFRTFWSVVLPMAKPALDHADDPVLPVLLERAGPLHHRHQRPPAVHADPWGRGADLGWPRRRQPVPDQDGRGTADDDPDGGRLRGVPAVLHAGRERGRGEGLVAQVRGPAVQGGYWR